MTGHGLRTIEVQDELAVRVLGRRPVFGLLELRSHPRLPLILTEILDFERPDTGYREKALARRVDREASEVASDPASAEPLGHGGCRARPGEAGKNQVVLVGRNAQDALEEVLVLLRGGTE